MKLRKIIFTLIILLYLITRIINWHYRPTEFTDVIYTYMYYAHLWAGGAVPYLEQWYEYPPGTIPQFYLPHLFDMATLNKPFHLSYLQAYRAQMLFVDVIIFILIILTTKKLKIRPRIRYLSLIYYCLITVKAHNFIYDSMDLTFTLSLLVCIIAPILITKKTPGLFVSYLGYFAGIVFKFINAPLGLILALMERKHLIRGIVLGALAFILVWGYPLLKFRSSLSVSFVYHSIRGLQVESVPAMITETINSFTRSEKYIEVFRNYDIIGPVSVKIKKLYDILFPLAVLSFVALASYKVLKLPQTSYKQARLVFTLGYIFTFMLFSKVLSTPMWFWHIPLLAIYPYKNTKTQLQFLIPSLIIIIVSMTKIPDIKVSIFHTHLFVAWIRSLSLLVLFTNWYRLILPSLTTIDKPQS